MISDTNDTRFSQTLWVQKRNGTMSKADFTKVDKRLEFLNSRPYQLKCNASFIAQKVRDEITDGIKTQLLDEYAAKVAVEFGAHHPDFLILAARISISNHQKNTSNCFSDCVERCYRNETLEKKWAPRVNQKFYKFVQFHKTRLNKMIDYDRDFEFTQFGFSTLIDRYLIKRSGPAAQVRDRPQDYVIERPQDLWMRVACAIHMNRDVIEDESVLADIGETYDGLSQGYIMHATPTLYNAGTNCEQFLSCFLLGTAEDSIRSIYKLIADSAEISKYSGGIGFWWDLRSAGSEVHTTNGISNGPVPFLRVMEKNMIAVDQGGKRPGSAANYMGPEHPDFMDWVKLRRSGEVDAVDKLFYAAWIPDEFMRRVRANEKWYFVDPHLQPQLYRLVGPAWSDEYNRIINAGGVSGQPVMARAVMKEICRTQIETGMPYMAYRDAINLKSNQNNIGVIKSSNLCLEIAEYSSHEEYACCCVSSICLPKYVTSCACVLLAADGKHQTGCNGKNRVDYELLKKWSGVLTKNLNKIIDNNFYPVPEAERSNRRHRPLAIGVQGEADLKALMKYKYVSPESSKENSRIYETILYGAMRKSCDLARHDGPYETFRGDPLNNPQNPAMPSPFARGIFQFDMWGVRKEDLSGLWDWDTLRTDVMSWGTRNSLLTSLPPTASTSHIQGNNEAFEPFTDNIYVRKTLSGEHIVINKHLMRDLVEQGLWSQKTRNAIIANRGSIQAIKEIPQTIRELYKTAWELDVKDLIRMDSERAPFIDQMMSSNRFIQSPTYIGLLTAHHYAWTLGLKSGMYYLRSLNASKAKQFSESGRIDADDAESKDAESNPDMTGMSCTLKKENGITCYSCQ